MSISNTKEESTRCHKDTLLLDSVASRDWFEEPSGVVELPDHVVDTLAGASDSQLLVPISCFRQARMHWVPSSLISLKTRTSVFQLKGPPEYLTIKGLW